jgi:3-oxoacyl-[acyl-carrier-protein] synthase III
MVRFDEPSSVGIVGIGTAIPEDRMTSRDLEEKSGFPEHVFVEKIGIREKPVAAPEEHPSMLAARAALDALRRTQVSPEQIDLLIYCGGGLYDYEIWSPSAKVQHEIGASNAHSYEVRNACNGGNLGLYLASRQMLADPGLNHALVVCSDTPSRVVDYSDESLISLFALGDGATAAVLRKNHPGNRILSYAGISDGSLADEICLPLGGTRVTWAPENAAKELRHLRIQDPDRLSEVFATTYIKNYVRVVRDALRKCGRSVSEVDFLFTNQVKKSTLNAIFEALDLPLEKTCRTMERYGHLMSSDTLLGLEQMLALGRIREGDLVVLASSGAGFHWAATVVQY